MKGNKKKEEEKEEQKEFSPRHNHVGITYIFITLSRTVFILDQKGGGGGCKEEIVCGRVLGAIGHQKKCFYFDLFGACKYVCATWESHFWSKLNAEFSLFYSFLYSGFLS